MANEPIPPLIDCARVMHYAIVDDSVRYTPRGTIHIGGVELGAVPRLVIARNLVDDGILLLHCDEDWNCLGTSGTGDIEDVMAQANCRYEGLARKWQKAPYSEAEFAKAVADEFRDARCSFCGRYHFQIDVLMVPGDRAMICGDCIESFHCNLVDVRSASEPNE